RLLVRPRVYNEPFLNLLPTRAVALVALAKSKEAREELEEFVKKDPVSRSRGWLIHVWLVLGVLRERAGLQGEATQAWEKALLLARQHNLLHSLDGAIAGSLSDRLTEEDAVRMVQGVLGGGVSKYLPIGVLFNAGLLRTSGITPVLRNMWRNERGRRSA